MFGYSVGRKVPAPVQVGICALGMLLGTAAARADETGPAAAPSDAEPAPVMVREESGSWIMQSGSKQKQRGLTLLCNFSARLFMIAADGTNQPSQTAMQGGIFGGYKLGRFLFGLGFDLSNFQTEVAYNDGTNSAKAVVSNTGFLFSPGAQVAVLRSGDGRVELIGAAQLGFGSIVSRSYQDPELPPELQAVNNQRTFYFQYRVAPGLRVWALPQLAFNLLTGLSGDHLFTYTDNPSGNQNNQRASTAFYVNLGAMGVF